MSKPQIIIEDYQGRHNTDLGESRDRLLRGGSYRDQSTIMVVPTRGMIPARVVQSWMGLITPPNQKFLRTFVIGCEVGEAYSSAIEMILANEELRTWRYVLTVEEDNLPPPDGLLKLLEAMEEDKGYAGIGGLYWTKGEQGVAQIWGDPRAIPKSYVPQVPIPDTLQPCNGTGMGFTLYKMDLFKDPKLPRPLFKTVTEYLPGQGTKLQTQDLYFAENCSKLGYKFAVDTRVRVGHLDVSTDICW